MNKFYKNSSNEFYLKLSDPLTIYNINIIKDAIINSLEQVNELNLDHEDCKEFDLSYLQLLISAKNTATANNKNIRLKSKNPESLISLACGSGFSSLLLWLADQNGVANVK